MFNKHQMMFHAYATEQTKYVSPDAIVIEYETEKGFAFSVDTSMNTDQYGFGEMTSADGSGSEVSEWGNGDEGFTGWGGN